MLGPSETCGSNTSLNSSEEPLWKQNRVKISEYLKQYSDYRQMGEIKMSVLFC